MIGVDMERNQVKLTETELTDLAKGGNQLEELMSFALQNGANYALKKPVSAKILQETIEKLNFYPEGDDQFTDLLVAVKTESPQLSPDAKTLLKMKKSCIYVYVYICVKIV